METTTALLGRAGAVDPIVEDYATWMRSWSASPRTIKARTTLATSRLNAWGLDGFTVANITAYLARPELKSDWSRATYHSHLTDLCAWLAAAHYIGEDPMPKVRRTRPPKGKPRPLSEDEVDKVLSVVQGRVRDWIVIALQTGLRAHEIAKIRGQDVDEENVYVLGKGGVAATIPMHPDVWEIAQRYPRSGYWFPGNDDGHVRVQQVSLGVGKVFSALGIEGSIHRCRHVYGTRLLRNGTNIRRVQQLMRHANLDTTANYTAADDEGMREAILRLPSSIRGEAS